ncbi:phospholipid carrier-dependent glycosyltransferase [Flavobacteriaceae bacterium 3-367]
MYRRASPSALNYIPLAVMVLLLLRLLLAATVPLLDKTEARYAEIARLMVETKDWVVLQVDYGFPFWAKPPLSTWLSAISFEAFGISELSARLPSFLLHLLLLVLLGFWVKQKRISIYLPAFILLSTPEFLLHTGVVSTDTALGCCTALAMLSFWQALQDNAALYWKYLFFVALGFGLLAKGPITLMLIVPPLLVWIALHKVGLRVLIKKLPWGIGLLTTLFIALPWYIMTEQRSPGFIDYFLIGEHFERFFNPEWSGDRYGNPKSQARGTIWGFLFIFAFPWIQFVLYKFWKERKTILQNKWVSFLGLWLLWLPLFFTFSSNILHTYILPSMVPMALLVLHWWGDLKPRKSWLALASFFPVFVILSTIVFFSWDGTKKYLNSDKYLLSHRMIRTSDVPLSTLYWKRKSYSGQFYTGAKIQLIGSGAALDSVLQTKDKLFLVVPNKMRKELPVKYLPKLLLIDSNHRTSLFLLNQGTEVDQERTVLFNIDE